MERPKETVPLNCIDRALLALHSTHDPMVIHILLTLDGGVDDARLRSALTGVLARYSAIRSTIHTGLLKKARHQREEYDRGILTVWDLESPMDAAGVGNSAISAWYEARLSDWMNRPLDPGEAVPCRVLLLRRTLSEYSLVFTFHHSAADGLQGCRFVGDVVRAYNGNGIFGDPPESCSAAQRGDDLVAEARGRRPKVEHFYLRIATSMVRRFVIGPFTPPTRLYRNKSEPAPAIGICHGHLNEYELKQIKSRARSVGASVNDVLVAACFRAVEEWNSAHGKSSRRIRVMIPVDLSGGKRSPVGTNQASFLSLSTTKGERLEPEKLLDRVRQRTSQMLREGTAFDVVYATHFCTHLPPIVPKAVARFLIATQIYLDTILLTNIGVSLKREVTSTKGAMLGSTAVSSFMATAPVVGPMGVSLCANVYNDRLYIAMSYKTSQFSEAQAKTFLNLYFHEVRAYQRTPEGLLAPEVKYREAPEKIPA
jgi:NRPS condensation-like uncharacterized protein